MHSQYTKCGLIRTLSPSFFVDVLEVLNEIKDQIIVTRVPDVVLDPIVRPLHFEFCDD